MKEIKLDTGLAEYRIGAGSLRFNPTDPNLYHRFLEAAEAIENLEAELAEKAKAEGGTRPLDLLKTADEKAKALLDGAFGCPGAFEKILGGVSLLAVCRNGQRAVTNLLGALAPILEEGTRTFYEAEADAAEAAAEADRRERSALRPGS